MKKVLLFSLVMVLFSFAACGGGKAQPAGDNEKVTGDVAVEQEYIKADVYETGGGELKVTLVGHGSLMFEYGGKVIHVDPYSQVADYSRLPKADLILLTHAHADHLDTIAINQIKKDSTDIFMAYICYEPLKNMVDTLNNDLILRNYDHISHNGIVISALPAYNIVHKNPQGKYYHPKGEGNGYRIQFGDKLVYVAGDTEDIPEMKNSYHYSCDIAFLPKNIPYTMTDEMFVNAAKTLKPKVFYPYHMSEFDSDKIGKALEGMDIEIKVRPMKN